MAEPKWDEMKKDVCERIDYIAALHKTFDADNPLHNKICEDLILPAVKLLGEFCACIEIEEK